MKKIFCLILFFILTTNAFAGDGSNPVIEMTQLFMGNVPERFQPLSSEKEIRLAIYSPQSNGTLLGRAALGIAHSSKEIVGSDKMLEDILNSPQADDSACAGVMEAISYSKVQNTNVGGLLQKMIGLKKCNRDSTGLIINKLLYAKPPIQDSDKMLYEIIDSERMKSFGYLYDFIKNDKSDLEKKKIIIQHTLNSKGIDGYELGYLASVIVNSNISSSEIRKTLIDMINSLKCNEETLNSVLIQVQYTKTEIEDIDHLLLEIINSKCSTKGVLRRIEVAINNSRLKISDSEKIRNEIDKVRLMNNY